ncbi:MAG: fructosamine kinase family protein [Anaerolineae bacterium]|nr:fructosamine kinase family protein [Anaerolineae bacterium]
MINANNIPDAVTNALLASRSGSIIDVQTVSGGHINSAYRISTSSKVSFILKQNASAPPRLFECEAAGLEMLTQAGMRTPNVWAVGVNFLLLEDLGSQGEREPDWEQFGRAIAHQHLHTNDRFGLAYDNYLGPLPQINTQTSDGWEFFGQHRVLRYLPEPRVEQTLTTADRQRVEQLVKRLPNLIPEQPVCLLHGDLWHTNMLVDANGVPSLIDPAVNYGWAEADLSMTRQYGDGKVPRRFYDAYNEVNPLVAGWWDRLELLYIRQIMAVIAFFGNQYNTVQELRDLLDKFA